MAHRPRDTRQAGTYRHAHVHNQTYRNTHGYAQTERRRQANGRTYADRKTEVQADRQSDTRVAGNSLAARFEGGRRGSRHQLTQSQKCVECCIVDFRLGRLNPPARATSHLDGCQAAGLRRRRGAASLSPYLHPPFSPLSLPTTVEAQQRFSDK